MNKSSIVNFGKKYLKGKVALKAGKAIINKRTGLIGLGIGAVAGAGYLTYSLLNKNKRKKDDITHIDDIEDNNPGIPGGKKIVV